MYKIKRFGSVKAINKLAKKAWESKGSEMVSKKLGKTFLDESPKFNLSRTSGGTSLSRFRKINRAESNSGGLHQAITRKGRFEENIINNMSDTSKFHLNNTVNSRSNVMKKIDARGNKYPKSPSILLNE